jgi:hypothetical protein
MTNTENEPKLLKTDTRGRVVTPPARRQQLLDEFDKSGLSGTKFAALAGVKYQTFASWLQARRRQRGMVGTHPPPSSKVSSVRWLEAVVDQAQDDATGAVGVRLPNGLLVEVTHAAQVPLAVALVRVLSVPAPAC